MASVLLGASPLLLLGFLAIVEGGSGFLGTNVASAPLTLFWEIVCGLQGVGGHSSTTTTLARATAAAELHLWTLSLSCPMSYLPYAFQYNHLQVY